MKLRHLAPLVGFPLLGLVPAALAHCGSDTAGSNPDAGVDGATVAFAYAPQGCQYSVAPPASRAYTALALDDAKGPDDAAGAVPVRVRVGLGGGTTKGAAGYADPTTSAVFLWETPARTSNARVRMGATPDALSDVRGGYVFTTPPPQVGFGQGDPEVHMHEVHACGLQAGATYYYQVGGGAPGSEVWSATQSFTTVPAPGGKIVVGVFGDSRDQVTTWQLVHQRMRDAGASLMLVSGDVVDFGTLQSMFADWLDAIWKDPAARGKFLTLGQIPLVPVAGNHENDSTQFYGNFAIPGEGDYAEQYASFDVGNTHFVMIDDQPIATAPGSDAATAITTWLDADLARAQADRAAHPFIFVINHRALFATSTHAADGDVLAARGALAPIFDRYHVDVVMNGHDHEYERSKPLTAGTPASGPPVIKATAAEGTTYIVNAGAGADAYAVNTAPADYRLGDATAYGTKGTKGYLGCYALLTLEQSKLTLTAYGLKSAGGGVAGDEVIDTLTLGQ